MNKLVAYIAQRNAYVQTRYYVNYAICNRTTDIMEIL